MTGQSCILKDYYPCDWADFTQENHWPVTLPPFKPKIKKRTLTQPSLFFSPIAGSLAIWVPSKRRRGLDRYSLRLADSGLPGSEIAIEYLRDKYRNNLASSTINQAGGVVLSFLLFLEKINTNIFSVTRQDIGAFVEYEQDRGLKINSVRAHLRGVYTFLNFMVEQELLSHEIMFKKLQVKLPKVLPKAIPPEDIKALLGSISKVRDKTLILLLLRTGMRIGELLNVKLTDIVMPERKILIYQGEKNFQGRVVYFCEDAEEALEEWLQIRNDTKKHLFYSRSRETISYVAAWSVMRKCLERAGLSGKGYSLHCLRHTFATDMLNAGLRIEVLQQLMGHQSIEVTMRCPVIR